jgi:hypothetical protein
MRGTPTSLRRCPARRRHMARQPCSHRPAMVGDPSRHGRCPVERWPASCLGSKAEPRVRRAKLLDRADKVPSVRQRQRVTRERPTAACPWRQALTPRGVEPLDGGGLDAPLPLVRAPPQRLDTRGCALDKTACGLDDAPRRVTFDPVSDQHVPPGTPPGPSAPARAYGSATGLAPPPNVGAHPIGTDQQGTGRRTAPDPLAPPPEQGQVPRRAALAAQPSARLDHHRQRHPHDAQGHVVVRPGPPARPAPVARSGPTQRRRSARHPRTPPPALARDSPGPARSR